MAETQRHDIVHFQSALCRDADAKSHAQARPLAQGFQTLHFPFPRFLQQSAALKTALRTPCYAPRSHRLWPDFILALLALALAGCASRPPTEAQIQEVLQRHPEIVFQTVEQNPEKFFAALHKADQRMRELQQARIEAAEKTRREQEIKNPKIPDIAADRAALGPATAPITLVTYSDFQCPFCARGKVVVDELRQLYGDRLRVVYKHYPLPRHPMATLAARYYEAVAIQNPAAAYQFHDELFRNQSALGLSGQPFLDRTVEKVGVNLSQVQSNLQSAVVSARLVADLAEARKFGLAGAPGFVVAGVSFSGAYPVTDFQAIIDQKLKGLHPVAPTGRISQDICDDPPATNAPPKQTSP